MYGKLFSSTFTGSMFGAGPDVFALWSYVVANSISSTIELNPPLLAAILGMPSERVERAIQILESPDPKSRNPKHDGRRLVHEGAFQYHVTSHTIYRNMRDEEGRRQYQRNWVKNKRANPVDKKVDKSRHVDSVDQRRPASTHSESESGVISREGDLRALPLPDPCSLRSGPVTGHELKRLFAAIRARVLPGTMEWQTPVVREGKETSMAELIESKGGRDDVAPTMDLFLRAARDGKRGEKSKMILEKPSFGFACWMADWTSLREELHGAKPNGRPKNKMEIAQEAEAASWRGR